MIAAKYSVGVGGSADCSGRRSRMTSVIACNAGAAA
jgi:hypothetical protein